MPDPTAWTPAEPREPASCDCLTPQPAEHQAAYDAVYALIRGLGDRLPAEPVHRNALIWRAVSAALDAATPAAHERGKAEQAAEDQASLLRMRVEAETAYARGQADQAHTTAPDCESCGGKMTLTACLPCVAREAVERGKAEERERLTAQIDALTRAAYEDGKGDGRAEGRRQATDGWEASEEWAISYTLNGEPQEPGHGGHVFDSRTQAERHLAAWRQHYPNLTYADEAYHRRTTLVGPWEPAEQPGHGDVTVTQLESGRWLVKCRCGSVTVCQDEPLARAKAVEHQPAEQPEPARCGACGDTKPGPFCPVTTDCAHPEPASGGTLPASGPTLVAENATPDCVVPPKPTAEEAEVLRGLYGMQDRINEMQDRIATIRVRHDPGALMEEPDLYQPHAALNERGHLRGCGCEECDRG